MSDKSFFNKLSEDTKKILKDIANQLKAHKIEMAEIPANVEPVEKLATELVEGALADGTVVKYSPDANGALVVGADVVIVSADGEVPAPDGDLVWSDNSVVTIAGGKVTEIKAADAPAEADMKQEVKQVSERVTKIVEKFEAVEADNKKLRTELENLKLKVAKQAASLAANNEVLLAFAEVPTEEPIETPTKGKKKPLDLSFTFKK